MCMYMYPPIIHLQTDFPLQIINHPLLGVHHYFPFPIIPPFPMFSTSYPCLTASDRDEPSTE